MKVKTKRIESTGLTPRPVHPKALKYHAFLGKTLAKQHMMSDVRWTTSCLTDEFKNMAELLKKRLKFNSLEKRVKIKTCSKQYYSLKRQCYEGRTYLKNIRAGDPQGVRNLLKNHLHLQRLYQKMPLHLVEENINQRTFVMRKERDRLQYRLDQLKRIYAKKLLQRSNMENRINYQNEFVLDEEIQSFDLEKKISNSNTRLAAILTINSTYKKVIRTLRHDEIFYEPILQSLDKDIIDQAQFIKHILFLGSPALVRFKELGEQYKMIDDKARKSIRSSVQTCSSYRKIEATKHFQKQTKPAGDLLYKVRRYVRETKSMQELKSQVEDIEETIKKIKIATLSLNERDIYPSIKSQTVNNLKLMTRLDNDILHHEVLETKAKSATVWQGVLTNNVDENSLMRLEKIKQLKEALKLENDFEEKTLAHIKSHSDIFVLLRFALWNLHDIMRHVGPKRIALPKYPVDYLKLPLLKYDMLDMMAFPPERFEENIPVLLKVVQHKLQLLMNIFDSELRHSTMCNLKTSYCAEMLIVNEEELPSTLDSQAKIEIKRKSEDEIDLLEGVRAYNAIPNRRQIKLASARLVEDHLKKDL